MSRYLALALQADEPKFRSDLQKLESASGHPNNDIRLVSQIMQSVRKKITLIGLDPDDTTPEELYHALNQKLSQDDEKLTKVIRSRAASKVNAEANITDGLGLILDDINDGRKLYVLKNSRIKLLLSKLPPKRTMKALGYRSVASLTKHENLSLIILAINNFESSRYITDFYNSYKDFKATDFEERSLYVVHPISKKWNNILQTVYQTTGLKSISCYELGSLIILPLTNELRPGELTASLVNLINEYARLVSTSTFLKLHQVSPQLGHKLYDVAQSEPVVETGIVGKKLSWHQVQRKLNSSQLESTMPHISREDIGLSSLYNKVTQMLPELKFWQSNEFLGIIHKAEATSMNVLDVANNLANQLDFSDRHSEHLKDCLWNELLGRYIEPDILEKTVSYNNANQMAEKVAA